MKTTITGRKMTVRPSLVEYTEKKLGKLDKFFDSDAEAHVTVSAVRNMVEVEVTIRHSGIIFRAEEISTEATEAVDKIADILMRQIRRNKTRLEKRLRVDAFVGMDFSSGSEEEESEFNIVRSKKFPVKPMSAEEAILQMNLIGHKFYMFRDMDTNEINVVYARNDGNYGLLEPDNL